MKIYSKKKKKYVKKNPAKLFFMGYVIAILIGGLLLSMPFSSADRVFTNPVDTIFTATSAVCVTGLTTMITASYWSAFGKLVIIILIQLGGLGVVTAAGAIGLLINKRFSMMDRMYIAEEKNSASIQGMVKLLKYVIYATFTIEGVGAILLSFRFIPEFGFLKGVIYSIFHAISAYCNAGFDILGDSSLVAYRSSPLIIMTISFLIIFGGLGFTVYSDITEKRKFKRLKLHTKIVLSFTLVLLLVPSIIFLIAEWNNPTTIGNLNFGGKLLSAFFQSVTTRTAGFFSMNQATMRHASYIMTIILMFIGGAPAGTAGGLKITTIFALIVATRANLRKEKDVTCFHRRIPKDIIEKSMTIFFVSIIWIAGALVIMSISDANKNLSDLIYEVISAYGTVGLTRGITPDLSIVGKFVIVFTMIFGKIGPIAMVYVFSNRDYRSPIREAEENILVG